MRKRGARWAWCCTLIPRTTVRSQRQTVSSLSQAGRQDHLQELKGEQDFHGGWLPKIPCIPVSTTDAIHLLRVLNTHGPLAADLSDRWHGGALDFYGVNYNVGPSPSDVSIHLVNQGTLHNGSVHNVIATIPGTIADDGIVIIGNHRDAWGPGAGDPNSGSAALNEVVRSFGVALKSGWRPRRTIIFASWEGEEFGQIGSLPWIRENLGWLRDSAVAYLNVVVAASGMVFRAKGSPLLYKVVDYATDLVISPNQTIANQSVSDVWGGKIGTAGGGDAIRFQGLPCVATVDFGFMPGLGVESGVFPYHTGFDTFDWMDRVGDPEWKYHITSAKIWSLMTARLAQSQVLDMSVTDYAIAIRNWVDDLDQMWPSRINLSALYNAIERLARAASVFDAHAESLRAPTKPCWKIWSTNQRDGAIRQVNKVYIDFERKFFYGPGFDDNPSLHHVMITPKFGGSKSDQRRGEKLFLPPKNLQPNPTWHLYVIDSIAYQNKRWRDIIIQKIDDATHLLDEQHLIWNEL
ncbi:hypothetical protein NUW58_g5486 [Xylaria curta]|uniref:Uncharacterized protein n=1 Tax=Xylaria curta TaxID=42375 RepID=A0ACC1P1C0_9PEZI|nr:hypothetical protein NUW58_g5486 [Xylaria curta]